MIAGHIGAAAAAKAVDRRIPFWALLVASFLIDIIFGVLWIFGAESMEAAWKYIIVVSAGISLALLGTVLFYWAGSLVLGPTYDMTWDTLRHAAPLASARAAARVTVRALMRSFLPAPAAPHAARARRLPSS